MSRSQIEAAEKIHDLCEDWKLEERAFKNLLNSFPGFEREGTLVKLAAVNGFYSTRYPYISEAERHVSSFLLSERHKAIFYGTGTIVEYLARVPVPEKEKTNCWSLMSKYLHFFINSRFPM